MKKISGRRFLECVIKAEREARESLFEMPIDQEKLSAKKDSAVSIPTKGTFWSERM